jgi:alcohol dehydrogenase
MKAIQINSYGNNDVIVINLNTPEPAPTTGQLLIKVHAAGVNPIDWKVREGYLQQNRPLQLPITLGMDFSGVVTEVGSNVFDFKIGDEVYGQANYLDGDSGSFAEFISVNAKTVAHKPINISHLKAAALPLAGISAWQAVVDYINISKGERILIHGGTGGIGVFAIQLAKYFGAYVATTVSTHGKNFAKELGADEIIDYKNQNFENLLHDYHAVFDNVGGETYLKSFKVLKQGGIVVSMLEQPNAELMEKYSVNAITEFTETNRERLSKLAELVDKKIITIPIAKTFILEQTREALDYLQHDHPKGKVVVNIV